jgi:hypothetical protein
VTSLRLDGAGLAARPALDPELTELSARIAADPRGPGRGMPGAAGSATRARNPAR